MDYLIGKPLGHSCSPRLHALLGNEDYRLLELDEGQLPEFFAKRDFHGLNVTIPYKRAVIPYLDDLTPRARAIGAVNTIRKNADGTLTGDNTDCAGFEYLVMRAGLDLHDAKVLILGTGGTSRTVRQVVNDLGAREIVMVSRKGPVDYENVYDQQDATVIVNATPVGMYPNGFDTPIDLSRFEHLAGALDAIYNPLETPFVRQARQMGLRASGGLAMLVQQARAAEEFFRDERIMENEMTSALGEMTRELTNLVLIGMPGCGKSTLGSLVAQETGRELLDTDQMVAQRAGMPVPEIFERFGEAHFRTLEEEAVLDACKTGGHIVAVGGGAVMSEKNRAAMRMNGRVYMIERPLEKLDRAGRPLSQSTQVLAQMAKRRAPIYQALCDKRIDNLVTPDQAAHEIVEDFYAYSGA